MKVTSKKWTLTTEVRETKKRESRSNRVERERETEKQREVYHQNRRARRNSPNPKSTILPEAIGMMKVLWTEGFGPSTSTVTSIPYIGFYRVRVVSDKQVYQLPV